MLGVEQWAELRRRHFVQGISIRQLQRDSGLDRKTIRRVLRSDAPPRYTRTATGSTLDPFKEEIHRLRGVRQRALQPLPVFSWIRGRGMASPVGLHGRSCRRGFQ